MTTMDFQGKKAPVDHLGDGVYAIFDGYGIMLHANDHLYPTDHIYLEPSVLDALARFREYHSKEDTTK